MRVEVEMKLLKESFEKNNLHTDEQFEMLHGKMDDLLALRYKGIGAFWLASGLLGTGIIGVFLQVLHYIGVK